MNTITKKERRMLGKGGAGGEALHKQALMYYEKMLESVEEFGLNQTMIALEKAELFYTDGEVDENQKAFHRVMSAMLRLTFFENRAPDGSLLPYVADPA